MLGLTDKGLSASAATRKARATRRNQLDVPYGDGEGEEMDIYFPDEDSEGEMGRAPGPQQRQPGVQLTSTPWLLLQLSPSSCSFMEDTGRAEGEWGLGDQGGVRVTSPQTGVPTLLRHLQDEKCDLSPL